MKNNIPAKHTHTLTTDETGNITLSISNGFVLYASPSAGTYWKSVKCKTGQGRSYEVPMLHAGNVPKNFREDVVPFPMNIRVKIGDLAPMFQGGDTEGAVSRDGSRLDPAPSFIPANRLQPVMIYIGSAKASDSREEFIVIFRDWDGTVLSEQTVIKGQPAEAPDTPSRLNYEFKEWDKPFSSIIANTEIYAVYQPKTYTVKAYSNNDEYGTVAPSSRSVVYGDMVELTASPARDKMLSCWIKHGSTYEEGTSDLRYKVYPNDNNIGADN